MSFASNRQDSDVVEPSLVIPSNYNFLSPRVEFIHLPPILLIETNTQSTHHNTIKKKMKANAANQNSSRRRQSQRCSFYRTSLLKIFFLANCCILQFRIASSFTPSSSRSHASIPMASIRSGSESTIRVQATTIDSPSGSMSDFERRMKKLVQTTPKTKTLSKNMPENIQTVETLEEFKKVICSNKDDKLIVVRFYAPWCKVRKRNIQF